MDGDASEEEGCVEGGVGEDCCVDRRFCVKTSGGTIVSRMLLIHHSQYNAIRRDRCTTYRSPASPEATSQSCNLSPSHLPYRIQNKMLPARAVPSSRRTSPSRRLNSASFGLSFRFLLTVSLCFPSDLRLLDVLPGPGLEQRLHFTAWLGVIARPPCAFTEMHVVDFAFACLVQRSASVQETLCNLRQALSAAMCKAVSP